MNSKLSTKLISILCIAGILIGLVGIIATCAQQKKEGDKPMQTANTEASWSEVKQARVKAAGRQRRVIFNDDTYELSREDANTPEGFLKRRLKPLVGTHVDTISWSVLGGWADAPVYDSKVQPIYGDAHGGPPPYWSAVTANVKALIAAGRGPLQVVIDFARDNGMEVFASVRMNDVHDSFIPGGITIWKKQHPELLVDTEGMAPRRGLYTTAQDYTHEQVRQRKLEIIEEICQRYDVDGFELDYIRHPVLFSEVMRGEPATPEQVEIMTAFMGRIRQITDEAAARRGRPILIANRVPDSFELAKNIGLDLKAWLEKDLVDILIAGGGYAPFSLPVAEFTETAHQYGVLVYPCINQGPAQTVSDGAFLEGVRALAANWYQAGADGIYTWNFGTPFEYKTGEDLINTRQRSYACLTEIGNPQALVGKNKSFCVDGPVFDPYTFISSQPPLPVTVKQGEVQSIPLVVGDDVEATNQSGALAELKLTIELRGPVQEQALRFRLNGETLSREEFITTNAEKSEYAMNYPVSAPPLQIGNNFIEWSLKSTPANAIQLYGVRLEVKYKTAD